MKYKIIDKWAGDLNGFPAFGYKTKNHIIIPTELYLPKHFGTQAVLELRDKDLKYIKLIGSENLSFKSFN